jgi:hypothetical protein
MPTFNTEKGTGLGLIIAEGDIQLLDGVFSRGAIRLFRSN